MRGSAVRDTRQKGLTRAAVAAATADVIADLGIEQLSMRKVAVRLGVTPMALYNHVHDKDELLELAAEHVRDQIRVDETLEPRAQLSSLLQQLRDLGAQQPRLVEGLGMAHSAGAARLTLSGLRMLAAMGLTPSQVRSAHNAITFLLMGATTVQRLVDSPSARRSARETEMIEYADAGDVDLLQAMDALPPVTVNDQFELALDLVLDAVRRRG